jgi:glutamyl-tRNA reductase
MNIFLLSITHRSAPLAIRERVAFGPKQREELLKAMSEITPEAVAIVTCNRTELYGIYTDDQDPERALALLADHAKLPVSKLDPHAERQQSELAARHLFRVAAGLDSLVVGEPQILGQVGEAAEAAREAGVIGPVLSKLFNAAVVTGKRARTETAISRGAASVSHAAVELARNLLGNLAGRQAMVIGVGEMGQLVARNLAAHGVADLAVCNRTLTRARELAFTISGRVVPWDGLDEALTTADIVISATSSAEPILSLERLRPIVTRRNGRLLLLIDIAVPRDIDPAVAELPGIHLRDIDALYHLRSSNLREREDEIPLVDAIVEQQLASFLTWHRGRSVTPVIRELRHRVNDIRAQEVEKALRRLGHLDERDRQVVLAMSHAIANKLLHTPIMRLKECETQEEYARAVADLFDLGRN